MSSYFLSYLFYNSHWYLYLIALSLVFVLDAYLLLYFPITQSFFSLIEIVNKEEKKIIKERKRTGSNKWKEVDQHVVYGTVDQKKKWWQLPVGTAKFIVISDEGWWWVRKMKGKRKREKESFLMHLCWLVWLLGKGLAEFGGDWGEMVGLEGVQAHP